MIILRILKKVFLYLGTNLFVTFLAAYILLNGFNQTLINPSFYQDKVFPELTPYLYENLAQVIEEHSPEITEYLTVENIENVLTETFPPKWVSQTIGDIFSDFEGLINGTQTTISFHSLKEKIPEFTINLASEVNQNIPVCTDEEMQKIAKHLISDKIARVPTKEIIPLCRPEIVSSEQFQQQIKSEFKNEYFDYIPAEINFADNPDFAAFQEKVASFPKLSDIKNLLLIITISLFIFTTLLLFKPQTILSWQGKTLFSGSVIILLTSLPIFFTPNIIQYTFDKFNYPGLPSQLNRLIEHIAPEIALPVLIPGIIIGIIGITSYFAGAWLKKNQEKAITPPTNPPN